MPDRELLSLDKIKEIMDIGDKVKELSLDNYSKDEIVKYLKTHTEVDKVYTDEELNNTVFKIMRQSILNKGDVK